MIKFEAPVPGPMFDRRHARVLFCAHTARVDAQQCTALRGGSNIPESPYMHITYIQE